MLWAIAASNELESWDLLVKITDAVVGASWKGKIGSWRKLSSLYDAGFAWQWFCEEKAKRSLWIWEWKRKKLWEGWAWLQLLPSPTILNTLFSYQALLWGSLLPSALGHQVPKDQTQPQACHFCKHPACIRKIRGKLDEFWSNFALDIEYKQLHFSTCDCNY